MVKKLTFAKLLSAMVASENGNRLDHLISSLRNFAFDEDDELPISNRLMMLHFNKLNNDQCKRIDAGIQNVLGSFAKDIDPYYFGIKYFSSKKLN